MTISAQVIDSPVGELLAVARADDTLMALTFLDDVDAAEEARRHARAPVRFGWTAGLRAADAELREYFAGRRTRFDLRVDPAGTPFQRTVWMELAKIPYGETLGYAELARRVGRSGAARAVGRANATNPIPIVLPCHRVIGANGDLTGYGGGLERKEFLLRLEGVLPAPLDLGAA